MRKYLWMVLITVFALMSAVPSRAEDGLQILTWPSGLVAGTINVEVSLGPSGAPAELFLDSAKKLLEAPGVEQIFQPP